MYVRLLYFPAISKSKLFVDLVAYRSGFNVLDKPEWGRLFRRLKLSGIHYERLFLCADGANTPEASKSYGNLNSLKHS